LVCAAVADATQGQQFRFPVVSTATASMGVMDLQLGSPAVLLAPPAITLQDLNAELPVIIGLEPQPLRCLGISTLMLIASAF
jgi:hypothetical protein